jgi:hypothetical protein
MFPLISYSGHAPASLTKLQASFMSYFSLTFRKHSHSIPHDSRNKEFAILKKPRGYMPLSMLGLGGSIGTPEAGINASVMVVKTFEELKQRSAEVR